LEGWNWSGRGQHIRLDQDEEFPFYLGRFLGRGATANVHEMEIKGIKVARKEIFMLRRCAFDPTELNLLKRTNHRHVVRLVSSYVQDQLVGLFLYPVAICSL
jgi:hypothetical protein